jgi:hypothetical protein
VVPGAGAVDVSDGAGEVADDWSLGAFDGTVDCCFPQADIATNPPRNRMSKLRFIDSPHCVGREQAPAAWHRSTLNARDATRVPP